MENIHPVPECLCKLAFFAGQVCPESRDNTGSDGKPLRKKLKKAETPMVSPISSFAKLIT